MIRKPKIVIIGAGSTSFGRSCIKDAFSTKELWGSELAFVDLDATALDRMVKVAERMNNEVKAGFKITKSTDRCSVLPGADFIITSIAINRIELWKQDFKIPFKYGIQHVLGENGGPGCVFHTMRNIPIILDICRDIEKLCPEALLINFTNPESRICLAIRKYTKVKAVGLCHQIGEGINIVRKILGEGAPEIDVKAFGLNHFTWFSEISDKKTGENLYPLFIEKEKTFDPEYEKLSRYLFHKFGMFPTSGDGHIGEYIPFAHELMSTEGYDFAADEAGRKDNVKFLEDMADPANSLDEDMLLPSGEKAFAIIRGITYNTNELIEAVNIPNDGYIRNLAEDAIVEVPAIVSGKGLHGLGMGCLPRGIAALCSGQINVQHLVVDAGATGNKDLVMQALLVDPNVPSAKAAEGIYNELMEINKPYLPQFKW